jgi:dihydropyrimidinase
MDIVFKGATIVSDGTEVLADLAVKNGRIAAIGELDGIEAAETVDAHGRTLLPGLVDIGVSTSRENDCWPESPQPMESLTCDALQGGVTTIVMPVSFATDRPLADELAELREVHAATARTDFSYHYLLSDWSEARRGSLRQATAAGVPSVWIANEGMSSGFPGNLLLTVAMREMPRDSLVITRPSDPVLESFFRRDLAVAGMKGAKHYEAILPAHVEAGAIQRLGMLMEGAQATVLLMGVSCRRALRSLQMLRENAVPLHAAVSIAHLALGTGCLDAQPAGVLPLTWPPLRGEEEQRSLWNALEDGLLGVVTSGHHPCTQEEVTAAQGNAVEAPGGAAGLGHLLPLLLGEGVSKFLLSLETLSVVAAADPAKMAGLYPRKGCLQIGSDADIVVCNTAEETTLARAGNGIDYHDPYAGRECVGRIEAVYLGGKLATGEDDATPQGRYLERRVSLA